MNSDVYGKMTGREPPTLQMEEENDRVSLSITMTLEARNSHRTSILDSLGVLIRGVSYFKGLGHRLILEQCDITNYPNPLKNRSRTKSQNHGEKAETNPNTALIVREQTMVVLRPIRSARDPQI